MSSVRTRWAGEELEIRRGETVLVLDEGEQRAIYRRLQEQLSDRRTRRIASQVEQVRSLVAQALDEIDELPVSEKTGRELSAWQSRITMAAKINTSDGNSFEVDLTTTEVFQYLKTVRLRRFYLAEFETDSGVVLVNPDQVASVEEASEE